MKRLENSIRRPLPILLLKLSRTVRVTYSRNFKQCNYATLVFQNSILYNSIFLLSYCVTSQNTFLIWDGESLRFYDKMLQINLLNLWPWLPSTIADGIQVEAPQYELTKTPQLWFYKKKMKDQTHNLNFEVVSTESARWTTWWLWKGLWSGSKRTLPSMCSRLNRGSRTPEVLCTNITNSEVSTHMWSSHYFNIVWYNWIDVESMLI